MHITVFRRAGHRGSVLAALWVVASGAVIRLLFGLLLGLLLAAIGLLLDCYWTAIWVAIGLLLGLLLDCYLGSGLPRERRLDSSSGASRSS